MNDDFGIDTVTEKQPDVKPERQSKKKVKIVYMEMTSKEILKKVKVNKPFKNKLELCKLVEGQDAEVVYPESLLRNIDKA